MGFDFKRRFKVGARHAGCAEPGESQVVIPTTRRMLCALPRVDTTALTRYRRSSCSGGISPVLGKENVRSASVDNRSRAMWLLAGLGVLIWAALSVFLGGSPAHADDDTARPPKPVQTNAAPHAHPSAPHPPRAEAQQERTR